VTVTTQCSNIPWSQQNVQRLADQFNQDEAFWRSLEPGRRLRRKLLRGLGEKRRSALDLLEFAALRPPDDCVGVWVWKEEHPWLDEEFWRDVLRLPGFVPKVSFGTCSDAVCWDLVHRA